MQKESIWKLLARKMAAEATKEELSELENLLKNDPEMNYIAETFSRIWKALPGQPEEERRDWNIAGRERKVS